MQLITQNVNQNQLKNINLKKQYILNMQEINTKIQAERKKVEKTKNNVSLGLSIFINSQNRAQ